MKRLLLVAIAASLVGACHWHSRAWLAQNAAPDKPPTKVVPDTQPIVRQEGQPAAAKPQKLHAWSRASAAEPMGRTSIFTSDGRMIGRYLMSNDVDLSFARIDYTHAESEEVKAFARRMATAHTQLVASRALTGRSFDSTYVAMELDRHHAILSMIDDVLLPRARNAEVREMLASSRPTTAAHIAHAEQLQATLARR